MAITTQDQALAGMQFPRWFSKGVTAALVAGRPASLWALGGAPGAGAFNATLNGVLAMLENSVSGTTLLIKGTDGTTTRFTKTVTTDAAAEPITGVN